MPARITEIRAIDVPKDLQEYRGVDFTVQHALRALSESDQKDH